MKTVLLIFSLVSSACSQNVAYEANVGLLPIGGFMLFYDSQGPLSYTTLTPGQVPKTAILLEEVIGESCQHGLSIPLFIFSPLREVYRGQEVMGATEKRWMIFMGSS